MNNFPAMTEERRQELIGRLQIYIRSAETAIKAGLATEEDVFNLDVRKIALAALTAKSIAWIETGTDGFERGSRLINYFTSDIQGFDNGTLIYAAPPAPVLKLPDVSEGDPGESQDIKTRHAFSNGFRFAIEEVKRLNEVK